jgi:hypothetical protein
LVIKYSVLINYRLKVLIPKVARFNFFNFSRAKNLVLPFKSFLLCSGFVIGLEAHFGILTGWTYLVCAMWLFAAVMLSVKTGNYPQQLKPCATWLDRNGIKLFLGFVSISVFALLLTEPYVAHAQFLTGLEKNFCGWATDIGKVQQGGAAAAGNTDNIAKIQGIIKLLINAVRVLVVFIIAQGIVKAVTAFQQQNEEWKELLVPVILTIVAIAVIDVITALVGSTSTVGTCP